MGIKQTISLNKVQKMIKLVLGLDDMSELEVIMTKFKMEVGEQHGDQADDQLEQGDEQTEDEEVEVLGGDQDEVEVRGGDQDEVEEQDGDQADKQLEQLRKGE